MIAAEDRATVRPRMGLRSVVAGSVVGATSLALDELSGPVGEVLRGLGGAALAWGLAALLVAYLSHSRRAAQQHAMALLVTATIVYYGLIVAIGHRWRGATLADRSSAVWLSLASVGRAVVLWLVGSVVAGAVLGWLGGRIRSGSWPAGAVAAGLLGGQAGALAVRVSGWSALDGMGWSLLAAAGIALLLAFSVPAAMLVRAARTPPWLVYLVTAAAAIGLAAVAWTQLEALRSVI